MRSVVRSIAALALVTALALTGAPATATALENETFGVTPFPERANGSDRQSFSIPLETGATFEDAVRIYNLTDEILNLAVYATDAKKALDDTTVTVGVRNEDAEGVGRWIDLSRKSVELEARDAKTIAFRVKVRSSDPAPDLGAIVVENLDRGLAAGSVQRLYILVRTIPPNTQTSSKRVRTFLVQSPWIVVALLGLVLAAVLVWVGARRARRPRDLVVQPGELEALDATEAPPASLPVITRLGTSSDDAPHARASVLERMRASAGGARRRDERPLLDDPLLVEIDEADEERREREAPGVDGPGPARPERSRAPVRKTSARKPERRSSAKPKTAVQRTTTSKAAVAKRASAPRATSGSKPRHGAKPKATSKAKTKPKPKRTSPRTDAKQNFIPLKDL